VVKHRNNSAQPCVSSDKTSKQPCVSSGKTSK